MIAEARILRLGPGPRRRRGRGSCRYGPGRAGGIGGDTWGQVRQTKPISGFFRLKMRVERKNKANLRGQSGSAVRPCRRERRTDSRQTKPISNFRVFSPENEDRVEKQSQFAGPRLSGASRIGSRAGLAGLSRPWEGVRGGGADSPAGGFGPAAPNKANLQVARCRATAFQEQGYGKTGRLWLVENKANLQGRGGSAERAGGSGPGRAKQTQFSPVLAWKRGLDGKTKPISARSAK